MRIQTGTSPYDTPRRWVKVKHPHRGRKVVIAGKAQAIPIAATLRGVGVGGCVVLRREGRRARVDTHGG
jgi:hypothetical protein